MLRFDRAAPGEGLLIYSRVENGKAYLEFQFFLKEQANLSSCLAHICLYDMSGRTVLDMLYPLQEEEPAKGMLLHPHLWREGADPYLYKVKVVLREKMKSDISPDTMERQLPLRTLQWLPQKGWMLNGAVFTPRSIVYNLPAQIAGGMSRRERMKQDLQLLKAMGANTLCLNRAEWDDDFICLCDEMGLLVWYVLEPTGLPEIKDLFLPGKSDPSDLYYYYKACWSKEPFVYPVRQSLQRQPNGNYTLKVYSNQKKAALYVEGVLFEFQNSAPEFLFEEIPAGKYPLQLTAEAGECRVSLTVY